MTQRPVFLLYMYTSLSAHISQKPHLYRTIASRRVASACRVGSSRWLVISARHVQMAYAELSRHVGFLVPGLELFARVSDCLPVPGLFLSSIYIDAICDQRRRKAQSPQPLWGKKKPD